MISKTGPRRSRYLRLLYSSSRHFPCLQDTRRVLGVRSQLNPSRRGFTSEGIIIAVKSLFTSALVAKGFDKNDIVARGIMPIAITVFNSDEFPAEVKGMGNQLIREGDCARK
jgi:hypothetical protein